MKKLIWMVLAVTLLTVLPAQALAGGNWSFTASEDNTPRLYADSRSAETDGEVHLSWHVKDAEKVALRQKKENGTYSTVPGGASLPAEMKDFPVTVTETGVVEFFIDAWIGGSVVRSSPVKVSVSYGVRSARKQGMEKIWRIQVMIFRSVQTKTFKKTFSQAEVDSIRNLLSLLPGTLFSLSDGRMCAVVTDIFEISAPVTSVSGDTADLIPEKDFSLSGCLNDDTTLLAVFAPLDGYPGMDWLGLGGYTHTYRGHTFYMAEFSSALADSANKSWKRNGVQYNRGTCAMVHEILHAVEQNSRRNGWDGFQPLHDAGQNGYSDQVDFLDWYSDLMTDSLKSGKKGFREISFYVPQGSAARSGKK